MSIFSNLDLGDLSVIEESPEVLERAQGGTQRLVTNKVTKFTGNLNGTTVQFSAKLKSANLSRISLVQHTSPNTGQDSFIVTGILNPVAMDIDVNVDGNTVSITEFLRQMASAAGVNKTPEEFSEVLENIGMPFDNGMSLFFQQFGASKAAYQQLAEVMGNHGAGHGNIGGRIIDSVAFPQGKGLPVSWFEVGTSDRSRSRTGQGFTDFLDAIVNNFMRILSVRKAAAAVMAAVPSDAEQSVVKAAREQYNALMATSRSWASTWSGAQKRLSSDELIYDPQHVPSGRLGIEVDGETQEHSFWTRRGEPAEVATNVSVEEPF